MLWMTQIIMLKLLTEVFCLLTFLISASKDLFSPSENIDQQKMKWKVSQCWLLTQLAIIALQARWQRIALATLVSYI